MRMVSFSLSHFQFFLSRNQLRVYADIVVVLVFPFKYLAKIKLVY